MDCLCVDLYQYEIKRLETALSPNFHLEVLFFDMHPDFLQRGLLSDVSSDDELLEREIAS